MHQPTFLRLFFIELEFNFNYLERNTKCTFTQLNANAVFINGCAQDLPCNIKIIETLFKIK
jgi:hypothetical protein